MRTLVIMRHAKAEASAPTDFERQLTDRGHAEATEAGRWLAERGVEPDLALVSAAARTQQTWEDVAIAADWDLDVASVEEPLYAASTEAALDLLREVSDDIGTLMLIGHNPTVAYLVQLLDDGNGDEEAGNRMALGYPTAAVAVMSYDGDWAHLEEASASVQAFHARN